MGGDGGSGVTDLHTWCWESGGHGTWSVEWAYKVQSAPSSPSQVQQRRCNDPGR